MSTVSIPNRNTIAAANTGTRIVVERLLLDCVTHHADAGLAVAVALGATDAFVVGEIPCGCVGL